MAELDRLDREHGLGAMPTAATRRHRRAPSDGSRRRYLTVLVSSVVVFALVLLAPTSGMQTVRRLVGLGGDRLDAAPEVPAGPGSYRFVATQPHSEKPVGYSPCRTIRVEVNPAGAPEGYDRLVDTAIEHTATATGLRFERIGLTERRPGGPVDRRQPVLIAWADEDEVPKLAGDVAGIGGSTPVADGFDTLHYVTGEIVLDTDVFDDLDGDHYASAQAIVDHEFGHVVGLDHVDDRGELMYPESIGVTTYGPGDLKGLALLGNVDC